MANANSNILERYQEPIWGRMDPTLRNCLTGSAILGLALLISVFVVPVLPPKPVTMDDIPERIARLILERPRPIAPIVRAPERVPAIETPPVPRSKPKPPPRRTTRPKVARDKGVEGRQRAQKEVTQNLAGVTGSLDKVLNDLSKALPASEKSKPRAGRSKSRRRRVRSGRTSRQLASINGVSSVTPPELSTSAIDNKGISIAAITDLTVQDGAGGDIPSGVSGGRGAQSGRNEFRSNESLLQVVRRYAPGIQYCYDNELKKNPGLKGKLVVSITVLASGKIREVFVVDNSLRSPAVIECVLSQIRGWQLPEIPYGVTSFKTPFVFTLPD